MSPFLIDVLIIKALFFFPLQLVLTAATSGRAIYKTAGRWIASKLLVVASRKLYDESGAELPS